MNTSVEDDLSIDHCSILSLKDPILVINPCKLTSAVSVENQNPYEEEDTLRMNMLNEVQIGFVDMK